MNIRSRRAASIWMAVILLYLMIGAVGMAQVPGTNQVPLPARNVPQFVDPMPHFAYPGARVDAGTNSSLTISMVPHQQVALSTGTVINTGTVGVTQGVGLTKVWAYQISDGVTDYAPLWPTNTIVAQRGTPVNVQYENKLFGETYANVGLVVDQTLHWADPLGNHPLFSPYDGQPPAVVHLHGGEVSSLYDGGPDSWFTPGNAKVGPSWAAGVGNAYQYLNTQEAATLWFHDHALGVTRLNVYAGMAGFYLLKDPDLDALHLPGWSGDNTVQEVDRVTGLPAGQAYLPEIEMVIQDRMFDMDGQLYFPNLPPNVDIHPYWTPEFVGEIITVNGKTWPYLSVAPRKYRFHILNGSNARFYELWLQDLASGVMGPAINQIGTDGGLLDAPVPIDPNLGQKLLLGPGERADVVIDFSASPNNAVWTLKNSGNTPFPKGGPPNGATVGRIIQFVVNGQLVAPDISQLPATLRTTPLTKLSNFAGGTNVTPSLSRHLTLNEVMGAGGPIEVLLNNTKWDADGMDVPGLGVTETPVEGTTEVWKIINLTADAHPIHLHLVQFQLVSRQKFNLNKYLKNYVVTAGGGPPNPYNVLNADGAVGGNPAITPFLQGPVKPANPNERGWKDTFVMYPGEVTTVVVRYAPTDVPLGASASQLLFAFDPSQGPGYVWHCHIIDHEDNEMMRPMSVQPSTERVAIAGAGLAEKTMLTTLNEVSDLPDHFALEQNYPNPFNPSTEIQFSLPSSERVQLRIFNMLGQNVRTLVDENYTAGRHTVSWNGSDDAGSKVSSGVYIYRLQAGNFVETKKMMVIK